MDDKRIREWAEKTAEAVWAKAAPTLMAEYLESAARSLLAEQREEGAKQIEDFASAINVVCTKNSPVLKVVEAMRKHAAAIRGKP